MKKYRWIQHTHLFRRDEFECSHCGARYYETYLACPNCGVLMKEKGKYDPSWVDDAEMFSVFDD